MLKTPPASGLSGVSLGVAAPAVARPGRAARRAPPGLPGPPWATKLAPCRWGERVAIDIDKLTEPELVDLNRRIVERLRFLRQMRAHKQMLAFKIAIPSSRPAFGRAPRAGARRPGQRECGGMLDVSARGASRQGLVVLLDHLLSA